MCLGYLSSTELEKNLKGSLFQYIVSFMLSAWGKP
jgi:hypothetical protein